jgi:hypothetical protein
MKPLEHISSRLSRYRFRVLSAIRARIKKERERDHEGGLPHCDWA